MTAAVRMVIPCDLGEQHLIVSALAGAGLDGIPGPDAVVVTEDGMHGSDPEDVLYETQEQGGYDAAYLQTWTSEGWVS